MKAKKSLIITLFAAVMALALGTAVAFAASPAPATDGTWDLTKHTVTYDGQTYGGVQVNFRTSDGLIEVVSPEPTKIAGYTFYDLTGAEIFQVNGAAVASNYALADYKALQDKAVTLTVKRPAYATDSNPANTKADGVTPNGWELKAKIKELEASTTTQEGSVEVVFKATSTTPADLQNGPVAAKAVYVQGSQTKGFKLDGKTAVTAYNKPYDGKTHTITADEVYGYTISYEKFDSATGKWAAASAISFKNVEDSASFRAVYTKNNTPEYETIDVTVGAAAPFSFAWNEDAIKAAINGIPANANPANYVVATGIKDADAEEALKYFAEAYEVTTKANPADESLVTWTIEEKEGVDAAALYKAFPTLSKNYGLTATTKATATTTPKSVTISGAVAVVPEIEFVDSPTAVTYKAKKLKKKAASFTVTAVADNGEAVTYKLIDAPAKIKIDKATGEITLNKGLKKGTYKIQVKAYIQKTYYDANGFLRQPAEYQNIKIKVKK